MTNINEVSLLKAAQAVIDIYDRKVIIGVLEPVASNCIEALRQAVEQAKGVEAVVEFQYKGATISGSAKDIAAVQEIMAATPEPPSVDALIAEIDGLGKYDFNAFGMAHGTNGDWVEFDELKAILDKYRSVK